MKLSLISALLAVLFIDGIESAVTIWAVPMQPKWPVVMTADVSSLSLSPNARFLWEFPDDSNQACTSNGAANVSPCIGSVVDHSFPSTGTRAIKLTITDSSLSSPLVVTSSVIIADIGSFPVVQRPEVRKLTQAQWKVYVDALYLLKANGAYDHLARIHASSFSFGTDSKSSRSTAHASPSFAVWHRSQIRVTERLIQFAAGDDSLGMPYWDWRLGWAGLEAYFGPANGPNSILSAGPFCNSPSVSDLSVCPKKWSLPNDYPDNVKALRRNSGSDSSFHFQTQSEYDALMSIPFYDLPPFSSQPTEGSFRLALEGWQSSRNMSAGFAHNGVHRWMGGTLGNVAVSFYDPLFLVHHSNVERLFTIWQMLRGCDSGVGSAICYRPGITDPGIDAGVPGAQQVTVSGNTYFAIPGAMYNDPLWPWNLTPQELLAANQGYTYLKPDQVPPPPSSKPNIGGGGLKKSSASSLKLSYTAVLTAILYVAIN